MVLALDDQEWRQRETVCAHTLNCSRPFSVTSLKLLSSAFPFQACDDHIAADHAHHEACLVEVVEVAILDAVLRAHVLYQLEPLLDKVGIFAEGSLDVVGARSTRL